MDCLGCHENTKEPLICSHCQNSGCCRCWPYFDFASEVCQECQERDSIAAISESAHTRKLRQIFNKKARALKNPRLVHPLPWRIVGVAGKWVLFSGPVPIAEFDDEGAARWARDAANTHLMLMGVAVSVYEKIRKGDVWFDGGKEDCALWSETKKLIT